MIGLALGLVIVILFWVAIGYLVGTGWRWSQHA